MNTENLPRVGAEVRIRATRHARHAPLVGALGTVQKVIKSRGMVRVKLLAPVNLEGAHVFTWEALPENLEPTGY